MTARQQLDENLFESVKVSCNKSEFSKKKKLNDDIMNENAHNCK